MRLRQPSPLLLLLLPSFATVLATSHPDVQADYAVVAPDADELLGDPAAARAKYDVSTKDAPVDGKDGKPHEGPFVEHKLHHDNEDIETIELPPLKGRPDDPTVMDGKRIPESNDGVMNDKNHPEPKEGTTGTAGGVSEKDKARKAKEGQTGERADNRPESPKEIPPLPHSEQEKILGDVKDPKDKAKDRQYSDYSDDGSGFEKPADLPNKIHDAPQPLPDSAHKDHLDIPQGGSSASLGLSPDENAGVIQPLHSFFLSLTMILFSEVGDKTFLVAALMAMKHDRMVVFTGAFGALITMTILSAVLGHAVPTLIPKRLTNFLASGLFFVFGAKLLREGMAMDPNEGVSAEMQEVEMEMAEKESLARKQGRRRSSISPYALEMGVSRTSTRKSRSQSRFPTPPRSPSTSPPRSPSPRGAAGSALQGLNNLVSLLLSPAWVQTFVMTFLGEWGDRSQIATIAMAAGQDYWWVTLGAILGHACCTGVAVIGGRAIAGRVSLKVVTMGGAVAFLVFGFIYLVEGFYA